MTFWLVLGTAFWLGMLTSVSPCPLATNIAAISFLARDVGNTRRVLLSGLLYTLGRTIVYVALGVVIITVLQGSQSDTGSVSRFLQKHLNVILGPLLILLGMLLLGLLEFGGALNLAGKGLQDRAAKGGVWWALPLGVLFALSFCPISAGIFFGSLIALSTQSRSPVLIPMLFGIGTAVPVIAFTLLMAFAAQYVGKAFNRLKQIERWVRTATGVVFIAAGIYYCLTHIYGLSLMPT